MPPSPAQSTPEHRILVPVLVLLGLVVAAVGSLGAPLVPTVAAVDRVSLGSAQWTLTITLLAGAVSTPVLGRLGDGPRRRRLVLGVLLVVLTGSLLTAVPLGFGWLLVGRALQGVGLGLTSLAIASARDSLAPDRWKPTAAALSITTVAGIGLGYPVAGWLTERFGVHAAYGAGAAVVAVTLVLAALVLPDSPSREGRPLDLAGAVLLGVALAGLLVALSQAQAWGPLSGRVLALTGTSLAVLAAWVWLELGAEHPLVDLRSLRNRAVLTADVTVLIGGVGMYLLLSLVSRFVQTPTSAGYGFGASVLVAGLVLTPFSLLGFVAGRLLAAVVRRTSSRVALAVGCGVVLLAMVLFAAARTQLWEVFVVMGVAGLGVGITLGAVPSLVGGAVPAHETGSAMSFNQVLRTVGFCAGSALSAVILEAYTPQGSLLPRGDGYQVAARVGSAAMAATIAVSLVLARGSLRPPAGADRRG